MTSARRTSFCCCLMLFSHLFCICPTTISSETLVNNLSSLYKIRDHRAGHQPFPFEQKHHTGLRNIPQHQSNSETMTDPPAFQTSDSESTSRIGFLSDDSISIVNSELVDHRHDIDHPKIEARQMKAEEDRIEYSGLDCYVRSQNSVEVRGRDSCSFVNTSSTDCHLIQTASSNFANTKRNLSRQLRVNLRLNHPKRFLSLKQDSVSAKQEKTLTLEIYLSEEYGSSTVSVWIESAMNKGSSVSKKEIHSKGKSNMKESNRSLSCMRVQFTPNQGWSIPILSIQGLKYDFLVYQVWVTRSSDGFVLAHEQLRPQNVQLNINLSTNILENRTSEIDHSENKLKFMKDDEKSSFQQQSFWNRFANLEGITQSNGADFTETPQEHENEENKINDKPRAYYSQNNNNEINYNRDQNHRKHSLFRRNVQDDECSSCVDIGNTRHEYDKVSAIYTLSVNQLCSQVDCCRACTVEVHMKKYIHSITIANCSTLPKTLYTLTEELDPVSQTGYVTTSRPYEVELSTGCYLAQLNGSSIQWFYGFTWVQPFTEPSDPNDWNTTFHINARPKKREIDVRWTESEYPYNFSRYSLQLWYQPPDASLGCTLSCAGRAQPACTTSMQVQPTPSYPLDQPQSTFHDMAPGWYCARVSPIDPRCPWGCAVRASQAVKLDPEPEDSVKAESDSEEKDEGVSVLTVALAICSVAVACLLGLIVACRIRRRLVNIPSNTHHSSGSLYTKVGAVAPASERPVILLAWTRRKDSHGHNQSAVSLLKTLLGSHFIVWDYLEVLSLPPPERELLMEAPAGWLHTTIRRPGVKVVIVNSAGAQEWQSQVVRGARPDPQQKQHDTEDPLDSALFPHLLQQLLHDTALVADYSKIFVVKFRNTTDSIVRRDEEQEVQHELQGIVPGRVYSLPMHLSIFTRALQSLPSESPEISSSAPHPVDLLQEFTRACATASDERDSGIADRMEQNAAVSLLIDNDDTITKENGKLRTENTKETKNLICVHFHNDKN